MTFNFEQENFQELLKIVRNNEHQVIPFIGAGLSLYGKANERLPLWHELIRKLIEKGLEDTTLEKDNVKEIKILLKEGKYILATDLLLKYIGEPNFRIFIQRLLDINGRRIPPALSCLICISWSLIVTTNLDRFIEKAWNDKYKNNELQVITNKNITQLAQTINNENKNSNTLLKIHGSVENYESWVLSKKHYENLLLNESYVYSLKNLFLRTLFFIGYGLSDEDFEIILINLKNLYPAGVGSYFALLDSRQKGKNNVKHLIREYGLQVIWYNYQENKREDSDNGHGEVLECIQELVKAWVQKNESTRIILKYFPELEPDFVGRTKELNDIKKSILNRHPKSVEIIGFGGEGKTSVLQYFIEQNIDMISYQTDFEIVYGCSFYRADVGRFINDTFNILCPESKILGIPDKVKRLVKIFKERKILLVLDGLEVVQNETGEIKNSYLDDIVNNALEGNSSIIITSRIFTGKNIKTLKLGSLSNSDVNSLFSKWDIDPNSYQIRRLIKEQVGRHALSIRVLAGLISENRNEALNLLNTIEFSEIKDEVDLLKANKVSRILDSYRTILSNELYCFMKCFSIFYNPVHTSVLLETLNKYLQENAINDYLVGKDLRPIILRLIKLRLLILEPGDLLTAHPTVRDYFKEKTDFSSLSILHKSITTYYINSFGDKKPANFLEAYKYFDLCYHAASAKQWELFHYYFYNILNRGHKNYLGYSIEAWDETIYLAKLAFPDNDLMKTPEYKPIYYISTIARAFKHIGESINAQSQYIKCIEICVKNKEPETAKYINNLLTLSISIGDLDTASTLIKYNIGTLSWQTEKWKYKWQYEHAFYSIGYLLSLMDNLEHAEKYCEHAISFRKEDVNKEDWYFFYHSLYYCDIMISISKSRCDKAIVFAKKMLKIAAENDWKETIALSCRCLAMSYRIKYTLCEDSKYLREVEYWIKEAMRITDVYNIPRFEIEVLLEYLRLIIVKLRKSNNSDGQELFKSIISQVESLIQKGSFQLYRPELYALKGWYSLFRGNKQNSFEEATKAIIYAKKIKYNNMLRNDVFSLNPLMTELGISNFEIDDYIFQPTYSIHSLLSINIEQEEIQHFLTSIGRNLFSNK